MRNLLQHRQSRRRRLCLVAVLVLFSARPAVAQLCIDEQHGITWHDPGDILQYFVPAGPPPVTVAVRDAPTPDRLISLDDAIHMALANSEVIRVFTGLSALSSGRTIYDTAIATSAIDQQVGRFDPVFFANSNYRDTETPITVPSLPDPFRPQITDAQTAMNSAGVGINKTNRLGGRGEFSFNHDWTRNGRSGVPVFNPSMRETLNLSYTQPLLAGAGRAANEAPIVIARLDLDRSFFQYRQSVQELVRGVLAGYWGLVNARTNLWAREQQVAQLKFAYERAQALERVGTFDLGEVAQRRVAFANFRASLIAAQADVLQREAALRNLLGLPPEDGVRLVPSTPPTRDRVEFDWNELFDTAQTRRPDLIELNLILQADQQRLIQSRNLARPSLDANALHRWNGLRGKLADRSTLYSAPDNHTDWGVGVTFSVPIGLRAARSQVRSSELLIARDRATIEQGLHAIRHSVATNVRNLDVAWQQYEAFQDVREAARENLDLQQRQIDVGRADFLVELQAISDWGNAVSAEAQSLTQYNTELANLENETGTILETHNVFFMEERYATIGPLGEHHDRECYPKDLRAMRSSVRYTDSTEAAEESFDLDSFEDDDEEKSDAEEDEDVEMEDLNFDYDDDADPDPEDGDMDNVPAANEAIVPSRQSRARPLLRRVSFGSRLKRLFR